MNVYNDIMYWFLLKSVFCFFFYNMFSLYRYYLVIKLYLFSYNEIFLNYTYTLNIANSNSKDLNFLQMKN